MAFLTCVNKKFILCCDYEQKELAKAAKGARWDKKESVWEYHPSKITYDDLCLAFKGEEFFVDPSVAVILEENNEKVKDLIEFKRNPVVSEKIKEITLKSTLSGYQKIGVSYALIADACAIFDEMGVGKTIQAISIAIARKAAGQIKNALIICPATLKYVWEKEINKHSYEKSIVVDGTAKKRKKLYEEYKDSPDTLFLIVNFEQCRIEVVNLLKLNINLCCIDESIRIKSRSIPTTKAVKKINPQYKIILSGYPVSNSPVEIWSQIDYIWPGYLGSYYTFEDRYVTKETIVVYVKDKLGIPKKREFKKVISYKNSKELNELLFPLYIRRTKKEVLKELPDKIYQERIVELSSEMRKKYNEMKEEMRIMIESLDEGEFQIKATIIITRMIRLSQITSGYINDVSLDEPHWFKGTNVKFNVIDSIVEECIANNDKCVIWSRFKTSINKLIDRYKNKYEVVYITGDVKDMKKREEAEFAFQNDENVKLFLGTIQAGGMGLTLTRASTEIIIDKSFLAPDKVEQAIDRLHRKGQKNTVVCISLIARNTIDEYWEQLFNRKKKMTGKIIESGTGENVTITKAEVLEMLK